VSCKTLFKHAFAPIALLSAVIASGCATEKMPAGGGLPSSLSDVPSVRLNYRYEPDVPEPEPEKAASADRFPAVQADFDQNRLQEQLERTIVSPDGKRILAVYTQTSDGLDEFRLDMYSADGMLIRKVTSDLMGVHFPDTIRWSPDSSNVAFVAMLRGVTAEAEQTAPGGVELVPVPTGTPVANANTNTASAEGNTNTAETPVADANVDANTSTTPVSPTPEPPTGILTFRTEQLYICDADGNGAKPITQNEGFIYFYYAWAPNSSMLAALAIHAREWGELRRRADSSGAVFQPLGRLRIVEKTGRERRLDDALTAVKPVWSTDSSKIAAAFETQIRIYDSQGNNPTQAALPLRNQMLISSQAYDNAQASQLNADANADPAAAPANTNTAAPSTLPDPSKLVSFNPIVSLNWTSPDILYFETAYLRRMKNEVDNATSFVRWHRLILTAQAAN
jgi:hypothetical protein